MGLQNALSPQIDLASDPRWPRITGTFGEDPEMAAEMAANYVKGFEELSTMRARMPAWARVPLPPSSSTSRVMVQLVAASPTSRAASTPLCPATMARLT